MVWHVVYIFGLAVMAALNAIFPRKMWGLFKSWKYKNPETVEPSDLVVAWYRFTGVVGAIALTWLGVWMLIEMRREATCNQVMAELSELHEQGGFDAVEQRADELGMEAEERTSSSFFRPEGIVVTRDDKIFGILEPHLDGWECERAFLGDA